MNETLNAPENFHTKRLVLRKPVLDDAEKLFRSYASDAEVTKYLTWEPNTQVSETSDWLKYCLQEWVKQTGFYYVITLKDAPQEPFGMIDMRPRELEMFFGYVMAKDQWGKGIMSEALKCLVDWSLEQKKIWRATAYCDVDNPSSGRVMEKAGMIFEGVFHKYNIHPNISDIPRDCRIYAKTKSV